VVLELKQELEVVSLVMLVVQDAQDHLQRQDLAVLQQLTANGEHTVDGVHVQ
jgi:hypothetical protein